MPYELFAGPDGLRQAKPSWQHLERSISVGPYQSAAFADLWYQHVGARVGATPLIVAYTEDNVALGVFPACVVPFGPIRLLTWLSGPLLQDYGDILWHPSARISVEQFVTDALPLLRRRAPTAFLYMSNVRHDAMSFAPLSKLLVEYKSSAGPYVIVPRDREHLLTRRSQGSGVSSVKRKALRFERLSENQSFDILQADHPELDATLTWLFERKKERFDGTRGKHGKSDLFSPGHEEFRRALAHELPGMRVSRLTLEGNIVAADLSCLHDDTLYGMLAAFEPDLASRSPGIVLTYRLLEHCCDAEIAVFDLGWGQGPSKYLWTDRDVPMTTFVSADLQGKVLTGLARVRQLLAREGTPP